MAYSSLVEYTLSTHQSPSFNPYKTDTPPQQNPKNLKHRIKKCLFRITQIFLTRSFIFMHKL
jgi:hypothetical protein